MANLAAAILGLPDTGLPPGSFGLKKASAMIGAHRHVRRHLERLSHRMPLPLKVRLWQGDEVSLADRPQVTLHLRSPRAAGRLIGADLGSLGEAYVEGLVDVDGRVSDAIAIASRLAEHGSPNGQTRRRRSWFARHSRSSDKAAIAYHYDVSNDFYARFLDPRMVYSCAYYRTGAEDLATAQLQKLDHVCKKLQLQPGQRLLDIGCGWGALVIRAAQRYGVSAVGVTLSNQQYELACQRVRDAGLADRIEIRLQDYRDIPEIGGYDRITSIGMFEHVGLAKLGDYFKRVHDLLKPGGIAMNHGITSSSTDSRWVGMGGGEFIDRYVFPDGELAHVSLAIRELSASGLELADAESLRRHYALTLQAWSEAFERNFEELRALAGEKRARIWRVYLAGCAWAFAQGWINLYQLLAFKPLAVPAGQASPLPLSRDYMYRDDWSPEPTP